MSVQRKGPQQPQKDITLLSEASSHASEKRIQAAGTAEPPPPLAPKPLRNEGEESGAAGEVQARWRLANGAVFEGEAYDEVVEWVEWGEGSTNITRRISARIIRFQWQRSINPPRHLEKILR